jgi:stage II sporulation protein D
MTRANRSASLGRGASRARHHRGSPSVRRTLAAAMLVLAAPTAASARLDGAGARAATHAAARTPTPLFTVSGRGWGHGVGMSQYGALGYAKRGVGYRAILARYYPWTTIGAAPVRRVRVLLAQGRAKLTIGSTADFTVTDGTGAVHDVAAGKITLDSKLRLKVDDAAKAKALPGPLTFAPETAPLQLGRAYRGQIQVSASGAKLQAVNVVGLEAYLNGVVPSEVPHTWAAEALKAQAVAARSYALSHLQTGSFDLYPDTRSQVYRGLAAEQPETNAAVQATAGQVVLYAGRVARTFFFSTSGGRTASAADAWGTPIPYLISVADPYDKISPYHQWGPLAFSAAKLGKVLRAPGRLLDVQTTTNSSRRVASVTAIGARGESTTTGPAVRRALRLRSTWFTVGVLALSPPESTTPLVYGEQTKLGGLARSVSAAVLEQRPATASRWASSARVKGGADGTFEASVKPRLTTWYRLAMGSLHTAQVRVAVAPRVRFYSPSNEASLRGLVRPVLPDARVEIQRLAGSAWRTVARTRVDENGNFVASVQLRKGTYRARVSAGRGFVPGTTRPLEVVSE